MSYRMSRSPGRGCPWGLYQQQGMPARLPPAMSLVRESPMRRISSLAQGPMAWSTGWKKSRLGFSAPRVSEINTPSSHAPQAGPGQFLFLYPLGAVGDGILLHLGVQIPQQLVTVVQKDHRLPQIVLIGAVKGRRVQAGEALLLEKHLEPLGEQFRLGDLSPLQLPPVPRI